MNRFVHLRNDYNEEITFHGIPFRVKRDNVIVRLPGANRYNLQDVPVNGSDDWNMSFPYRCSYLFFLGMSNESWLLSEWWGQQVMNYDHSSRVFIGDKLGRIKIIYSDETEDCFPVIFGVNCWNYHLFYRPQPHENLNSFAAPYDEPFRSDENAMKLLKNSLKLMENTEGSSVEKNTKWVFGIKISDKKDITNIQLIRDESKKSDFAVSAVTGMVPEYEPDASWIITDLDFYLKKAYYKDMDKLARRLYQFKDELPQHKDKINVEGFDAPDITFYGDGIADIYTNIYRRNITDMAYSKIDDDGHVNVSSREHLDYGCYIGFGTYAKTGGATTTWTRDAGRSLSETLFFGYSDRCRHAADYLTKCLYTANYKFKIPQWKRVANVADDDENLLKVCKGKENDGHAAIMMFIYSMFNKGAIDLDWLYKNRQSVYDAANFFVWQSEHPEMSNFDRILFSESEASTQIGGGYDLFSNIYACTALRGYAVMLNSMASGCEGTSEDSRMAGICEELSSRLYDGCAERFTMEHPRYGSVYTDTLDDCWTYEYKRFCDLFIRADIDGYDIRRDLPGVADKAERSLLAQKEIYYSPMSGRQMGYGQGYLTETVLMLDRFEDITECVEGAAMMTYHHSDEPYMVPEGVIVHGDGAYWYRQSDLGNSVQQGEIIKAARLILGLDDISRKRGLRIVPRIPDTWDGYSVRNFKITNEKYENTAASVDYKRINGGYKLNFSADEALTVDYIRFGPFKNAPTAVYDEMSQTENVQVPFETVCINGRYFAYVNINKNISKISLKACSV